MPQITAVQDTLLKDKPYQANKCDRIEPIAKDLILSVVEIRPERDQHMMIVFNPAYKGKTTWFIFAPHWRLPSVVSNAFVETYKATLRLNVPYYAQNDNEAWITDGAGGNTQCMVTSTAMLVNFIVKDFEERAIANGFTQPEEYLKSKYYKYSKSRGDHDAMTVCLEREFGIKSIWRYTLNYDDIKSSIRRGIPPILGFHYKIAGHIVIATGFNDDGVFINDPYGVRQGSDDLYTFINPGWGNQRGKNDFYSYSVLKYIWSPGNGWGRIVV